MRPNTPNFVKERLAEARSVRGLTATKLAQLVGVSKSAISQYESGETTPHPDVLARLAGVLNVRPGFFLKPARARRIGNVYFRAPSRTATLERDRGESKLEWLLDVAVELRASLNLPEPNMPRLGIPNNPETVTLDVIESMAGSLRRHWGIGDGPISDVTLLLEKNGVLIGTAAFDESNMDSFSAWHETANQPVMFINKERGTAARIRFDVAHELGHLVLHRRFTTGDWDGSGGPTLREAQANKFATAFLMPRQSFLREFDIPTIDALRALKPRWKSSIQSMLYWLGDLEVLTETERKRLIKNVMRRGWRKMEPFDDELPVEWPRLLNRAFHALAQRDSTSPISLVERLQIDEADVIELAQLPEDFFNSLVAGDNLIRFKPAPAARHRSGSQGDNIVQFDNVDRY